MEKGEWNRIYFAAADAAVGCDRRKKGLLRSKMVLEFVYTYFCLTNKFQPAALQEERPFRFASFIISLFLIYFISFYFNKFCHGTGGESLRNEATFLRAFCKGLNTSGRSELNELATYSNASQESVESHASLSLHRS